MLDFKGCLVSSEIEFAIEGQNHYNCGSVDAAGLHFRQRMNELVRIYCCSLNSGW